jgi:PAS domain S-box-containing protein
MDVRQHATTDVESGFIGFIVYLEEITNQKSVERSLNAERNFINTILDTMQALMVVIDRSGRIVRINRACEQFFGYSHLEIFNKRVWDLVQTQNDLVKNEMFANLQAGLNPFLSLNHWVTSEGAQKLIAWSSAMVRNERDGQQYIVAVGIDMTDRVRIEGLLEQERLLLRHLIDSIPDLIFYKDVHGVYQGWNKAFRVFRGTKTDAIKEKVTDADIYPAEKVQQFKDTDRKY